MIASFKYLLPTLLLGAVLHGASADTVVTAPGAGAQWSGNAKYEVRWIGAEEDSVDVNLVKGLPDDRAVVLTLCKNASGTAGACTAHVPAELAPGIDYAVAVGSSEYSYSGYFSINVKDGTDCANADDETCRNSRHEILLQKRGRSKAKGKRLVNVGGNRGIHREEPVGKASDVVDDFDNIGNDAAGDTTDVVDDATGPVTRK